MTKTYKPGQTTQIGPFAVYKASGCGLWVVRDRAAHEEVAHELTKADAIAVARRKAKAA